MIVRMSKVVVMGPLDLLMDTLTLIQQLGIMQVDSEVSTSDEEVLNPPVPQLLDRQSVLEHQLFEKLRKNIDELLYYLPPTTSTPMSNSNVLSVETLLSVLPAHLEVARNRKKKSEELVKDIAEHEECKGVVEALSRLEKGRVHGDIKYLGVRLHKMEDFAGLQVFFESEFNGKAIVEGVSEAEGKPSLGVVIVEKEEFPKVIKALEERNIKSIKPPGQIDALQFSEQSKVLSGWIKEKKDRLEEIQQQESEFIHKWYGAYLDVHENIVSRLSIIDLTASVVRSRMCFFIHGWIPASDFQVLVNKVQEKFQGKVVVEEHELAEKDFSRIPTALHNPAYFEPFELFTRLLPMPPYASFDMTPFIGIFFPVFFGMMLGDIGYGLILLGISIYLVRRFDKRKNVQDGGKILFISSLYTIVFGLLYGELFGTVGHDYLGMKPILFDRQASIIPMFCFAIAAGVIHVIIGLVLGVIVSLRRKMKKEAIFKLVNIFIILCICVLAVSHFTRSVEQIQKPLLLVIGVATPAVLLVGGLMAPLELLKNIGNIISYARIMAVGLTSVLLAFVANYMAGRIGSVWAGITVALLLHIFNLLLGVFAPTIHSLRLHYVEFLSKFMEPGGKEFKPLGRKL